MNLVGKILIVLILFLSIAFLVIGMAVNASHQNWKELALENKEEVEDLRQNRAAILAESQKKEEQIEKEKVARMLRIQQLEAQLQLTIQDYEQAVADLAAQRITAQRAMSIADQQEERLNEQNRLVESLQTQLRQLTEDVAEQREKVVAMTGQIFEKETALRNLRAIRDDLAAENTASRKVLRANGLTRFDLTSHIPPEVQGRVTAVDQNDNIVVNLGRDDGLREGHSVDIHRDGKYVGTATIFETQHNRSAASVDPALTRIPVQINDRVTTEWVLSQDQNR